MDLSPALSNNDVLFLDTFHRKLIGYYIGFFYGVNCS